MKRKRETATQWLLATLILVSALLGYFLTWIAAHKDLASNADTQRFVLVASSIVWALTLVWTWALCVRKKSLMFTGIMLASSVILWIGFVGDTIPVPPISVQVLGLIDMSAKALMEWVFVTGSVALAAVCWRITRRPSCLRYESSFR